CCSRVELYGATQGCPCSGRTTCTAASVRQRKPGGRAVGCTARGLLGDADPCTSLAFAAEDRRSNDERFAGERIESSSRLELAKRRSIRCRLRLRSARLHGVAGSCH